MGNLVRKNLAEEREIPLAQSAGGKNCYKVDCSQGRATSYGVCQHIVKAYVRKDLRGFEECKNSIEGRDCMAAKMMTKERREGRCLWYDEYVPPAKKAEEEKSVIATDSEEGQISLDQNIKSLITSRKRKSVKKTVEPAPVIPERNDMAELVTKMSQEERAQEALGSSNERRS